MSPEPGTWALIHRCRAVTRTVRRLLGVFKDAEAKENRGPFPYGTRTVNSRRRFSKGRGDGQFLPKYPGQEIALGKDPL